jgi:adenylate cyclase
MGELEAMGYGASTAACLTRQRGGLRCRKATGSYRAMAAQIERRMAVVLCADVVGYSRLMGSDEEGTLAALNSVRRDIVDPKITDYRGRTVRTMGDGLLVEFNSVIDAVKCAVSIQDALAARSVESMPKQQIRFRMGLNIGDVVSDGEAIYGDGIVVASRLESLAQPGGINISRAVRDQIRDQLPITLADLGEHTVANLGRPVRAFRIVLDPQPQPPADAEKPPMATERSSLAVLPFQNQGGDAATEFFLDSVAEDLITELARARWFGVIARNTAFSYKGKAADSKQVSRELRVRYVVEGSLRKAGPRIRISCHLVEAASGHHVWTERFDGTLEDSFELQDRIVERVIGAVGPALRSAEIERIGRKPAVSPNTYELTLRAIVPALAEAPDESEAALHLLDEALAIDRRHPLANALGAWCHLQRHLLDWPAAQPNDRERAKRLARIAIDSGAEVPLALAVAAAVRAALTRDHALALVATDRATMLCSNSALVLSFDSLTRCICGDYDKAIAHAEKGIRLSPREPLLYLAALPLSMAYLMAGRHEEAVAHARKALEANPRLALARYVLAAALARAGQSGEATEAVERLQEVAPRFRAGTLHRIRFADSARLQADVELLRAVGLPG